MSATVTELQTHDARRELLKNGFCRFPHLLTPEMLTRLRAATERMLQAEQAERTRAQGSMLPTTSDSLLVEIIAYPPTLAALASLGFSHSTFTDGYVISKPGGTPRLFWHYDWFERQDPFEEADAPVQARDLLVGDVRLLHASHANRTDERRTLITLWHQPDFTGLPPRIQAQMAAKTQPAPGDWLEDARRRYEALLPQAHADAVPYERTLYRAQDQ